MYAVRRKVIEVYSIQSEYYFTILVNHSELLSNFKTKKFEKWSAANLGKYLALLAFIALLSLFSLTFVFVCLKKEKDIKYPIAVSVFTK